MIIGMIPLVLVGMVVAALLANAPYNLQRVQSQANTHLQQVNLFLQGDVH
jgi:hypothetical protein